jgi:hypothetical protein
MDLQLLTHLFCQCRLYMQDPTLLLVTRAGLALGSAGPSINLASSCEVLVCGLGSLTPMPSAPFLLAGPAPPLYREHLSMIVPVRTCSHC